jgi:hypothetical protein
LQSKTRRFLGGLSRDELQFIAEYFGASILESAAPDGCSPPELAERIVEFHLSRLGGSSASNPDLDHKTILLVEFLRRSGLRKPPVRARAAHA